MDYREAWRREQDMVSFHSHVGMLSRVAMFRLFYGNDSGEKSSRPQTGRGQYCSSDVASERQRRRVPDAIRALSLARRRVESVKCQREAAAGEGG